MKEPASFDNEVVKEIMERGGEVPLETLVEIYQIGKDVDFSTGIEVGIATFIHFMLDARYSDDTIAKALKAYWGIKEAEAKQRIVDGRKRRKVVHHIV